MPTLSTANYLFRKRSALRSSKKERKVLLRQRIGMLVLRYFMLRQFAFLMRISSRFFMLNLLSALSCFFALVNVKSIKEVLTIQVSLCIIKLLKTENYSKYVNAIKGDML